MESVHKPWLHLLPTPMSHYSRMEKQGFHLTDKLQVLQIDFEMVEEGHNGFIFHSGDMNDLIDKMQQLLAPVILANFKRESIKRIANYSIQYNVLRMESILLGL